MTSITEKKIIINIVTVFTVTMFFSCKNDAKEVRDFLADKNLPIGESYNIDHKHTDSGRIDIKMNDKGVRHLK